MKIQVNSFSLVVQKVSNRIMRVKYPTSMPIDAINSVVSMVKSRDFSDKAELGEALWNVQGYVQSKILGDSSTLMMASPDLSDQQAIEYLQQCTNQPQAGQMQALNLPWAQLGKWAISLALKLLNGAV